MLDTLRLRIQALWLRNRLSRVALVVGALALVLVLLCGCLNLVGTVVGNWLFSAAVVNPDARPTIPPGSKVANSNPTFPVPKPTVYGYPNPYGATPVGASGTPAPTPTVSPTPNDPT